MGLGGETISKDYLEKSGLNNDHISLSDYILKIPSNKKFSSINLSHAVTIVCYEISKSIDSIINNT